MAFRGRSIGSVCLLLLLGGAAGGGAWADGVGPDKKQVEAHPELAPWRHARGLLMHPYTFRVDRVPASYPSFEEELRQFYFTYGVDGVFTDFPDKAIRAPALTAMR